LHGAPGTGITVGVARALVAHGAPLEARTSACGHRGYTPLGWAASHGDDKAMIELLRLGADPREAGAEGRTMVQTYMRMKTYTPRCGGGATPAEKLRRRLVALIAWKEATRAALRKALGWLAADLRQFEIIVLGVVEQYTGDTADRVMVLRDTLAELRRAEARLAANHSRAWPW